MQEAVVCASCPEVFHDQATELCRRHGIQKAFGKAGDMLNSLSGKEWVPKWEAKVVMAAVTKAQTLGVKKALILCIAGGKNCDAEMARQPHLVRAIKTEMEDPDFRVRVEWLEKEDFLERFAEPGKQQVAGGPGCGKGAAHADAQESAPKGKGKGKQPNTSGKGSKDGQATQESDKGKQQPKSGKGVQAGSADAQERPAAKASAKADAQKQKQEQSAAKASAKADVEKHNQASDKGKQAKAAAKGGQAGCPGGQASQAQPPTKATPPAPPPPPPPPPPRSDKGKQAKASAKGGHAGYPDGQASQAQPPAKASAKANPEQPSAKASAKADAQKQPPASDKGKLPCKFFAQGHCQRGAACSYLHIKAAPLCKYFAKGKCKNGPACLFSHSLDESKSEKPKAKSPAKGGNSVQCKECGKSFKNWNQMCSKHWFCKGHEPLCMCSQCGKDFVDVVDCEQHQKDTGHKGKTRVNDPRPPAWACEQCGKEFASSQECQEHQLLRGHGNVPCCLGCSKHFGSKKAINQHQDSTGHFGIQWLLVNDGDDSSESGSEEEDEFLCQCGRSFFSQKAMSQHMDAVGCTGYSCFPGGRAAWPDFVPPLSPGFAPHTLDVD